MKAIENFLDVCYRINSNDKRYKYYKELLNNLNADRTEIIKLQNASIKKLINHAYNNSVYYKKMFTAHGINPLDITSSKDLMKIPPLTKDIINKNMEDLKTNDVYGKNLKKVTSGGSTGIQAVIYKSPYFEQMSRAAYLRNNSIIGWMPSDKSAWIWGSPIEHASLKNNIKVRVGGFLNRRIILNAYSYAKSDFPEWHNEIIKFQPKILYGYASIILEFARFIIANNLLLPSIKMVVSTTEKLLGREVIAEAFKCNVYNQYGCREVVAIGIETNPDQMIITDDVVIVNTNEKDEFLLTPLHSFGFPLINYKVGDTGQINSIDESSGKYPFQQMNLKIGRITENFITHDNKKVSSSAFSTYLSTLNLGIQQHQIIQSNYKEFTINYIPDKNTNHDYYRNKLSMALKEYFGENLIAMFNVVGEIPVEKSGKRLLSKRTFNLEM